MHEPITHTIAAGFLRMENDAGQSTANYTTKGVDDLWDSSMDVGCLRVVAILVHLQYLLESHLGTHLWIIVISCWLFNKGGQFLNIINSFWFLRSREDPGTS